MRILLTIAEMARGGAERMVVLLAAELARAGHEVALAAAPGPLDADLPAQVQRHELAAPSRSPAAVLRGTARLAGIVRRTRPELIHAHNVRLGAMAILAARMARPGAKRPPVLVTFHGVVPGEYRAAARILGRADRVSAVSADAAARLADCGLAPARLSIVRNATRPAPPAPASALRRIDAELGLDGAPVVAAVGRLVPQKAHARFLEAAARVHRQRPETGFLIIGDGPLRSTLEDRARELELSDVVRFTGSRPDVALLLQRTDVLVFSSDWEGLSIAALEAMAAGVPIVSTPVEGMSELIAGGAGVITGDFAAQPLADAVLALLSDPDRRAVMGEQGRRMVRARFSPERMIAEYLAVYAGLTAKRR